MLNDDRLLLSMCFIGIGNWKLLTRFRDLIFSSEQFNLPFLLIVYQDHLTLIIQLGSLTHFSIAFYNHWGGG